MSNNNWPIEQDAGDYFGNQKKKLELADRRPVIRRASDLVGPGIGVSAVRAMDLNDRLATSNGYFSAPVGAVNSPDPAKNFIGISTVDSTLGGVQLFWDVESGQEYTRVFQRNAMNPDFIYWGEWEPHIVATTWYVQVIPDNLVGVPYDWSMNPFTGQLWRKSITNTWDVLFHAASVPYVDAALRGGAAVAPHSERIRTAATTVGSGAQIAWGYNAGTEWGDLTYDTGTGVWTIGTDGRYQINASVAFNTSATATNRWARLYVNGAEIETAVGTAPASALYPLKIVRSLRLSAGDTLGIQARQDSGGVLSGHTSGGGTNTATISYLGPL